jgi:hypothetical protein
MLQLSAYSTPLQNKDNCPANTGVNSNPFSALEGFSPKSLAATWGQDATTVNKTPIP